MNILLESAHGNTLPVADTSAADYERLRHFQPEFLSPSKWAVAQVEVLAAVRAVPGLTPSQHAPFASRLCRFLAVCGWDGRQPPDLAQLLSFRGIAQAVTPERMPGLSAGGRNSYRVSLRRIARAVSAIPAREPSRTVRPSSASVWWGAARWHGPLPVLAAAATLHGTPLHPGTFSGNADVIRADGHLDQLLTGSAHEHATGTVNTVRRAARELRDAPTLDFEAVETMIAKPSPHTTHVQAKSASARARAARNEFALRHAAGTGRVARTADQLPKLPADVQAAIASYVPQKVDAAQWEQVGDVTRLAITAYAPTSTRWVHNQSGKVTQFVIWATAASAGIGTADFLLTDGLVDRYLAGPLAGAPTSSRATARAILRRIVTRLDAGPAPERLAYTPIQPPYTPGECAAFVRLARNQPTRDLRRALSSVIALGLGAGLDGADQRAVTPADIVEIDVDDGHRALLIAVKGPRPRAVVVRATYEPLLREALALHAQGRRGRHTPLYGRSPARRNVVSTVAEQAVTATGTGVNLSAARLRATWLLAAMNAPVPLAVLLNAAGLRTARTLTDLLDYCPPIDPPEARGLLNRLPDPSVGAWSA